MRPWITGGCHPLFFRCDEKRLGGFGNKLSQWSHVHTSGIRIRVPRALFISEHRRRTTRQTCGTVQTNGMQKRETRARRKVVQTGRNGRHGPPTRHRRRAGTLCCVCARLLPNVLSGQGRFIKFARRKASHESCKVNGQWPWRWWQRCLRFHLWSLAHGSPCVVGFFLFVFRAFFPNFFVGSKSPCSLFHPSDSSLASAVSGGRGQVQRGARSRDLHAGSSSHYVLDSTLGVTVAALQNTHMGWRTPVQPARASPLA